MIVMSGIWKPSLFSAAQSLSPFCRELQCCYGRIFEEEIYDTHMVISSLLAKAWKTEMSISQQVSPTIACTHTHRDAGSCTSKHTNTHKSANLFQSPTVQFLQPIHHLQLSLYCQCSFENTQSHIHTHTQWSKYPRIHKTKHKNTYTPKHIYMHKNMEIWTEQHSHTWIFVCVWCLANLGQRLQLQSCVWMINTAWYMNILWAHKKLLGSRFPSLTVSFAPFPNWVLKRNIKYFCSSVPLLRSLDLCVWSLWPWTFRCCDLSVRFSMFATTYTTTIMLLLLQMSAYGKLKYTPVIVFWPRQSKYWRWQFSAFCST